MFKASRLVLMVLVLCSIPLFAMPNSCPEATTVGTAFLSFDKAQLDDSIPPDTPILDTVSVNNIIGKAVLGWEASLATDVTKYYIYHQIGAPWFLIDSVDVPGTSYTDVTSIPQFAPEAYRIAALDSAKKLSPMGNTHQTIHLSMLKLNPCDNIFSLTWTSYINLNPTLAGYRIMVSENGSAFSQLAINTPNDTTFDHTNLNPNSQYCYYVQAFDSLYTKISTSNMQCATARKPNKPNYVYLRYATIKDKDHVRVGFFVDSTAHASHYIILRSEDGVTYKQIAIVPSSNIYANQTFDDKTAKINEKSYYYKVAIADSCGTDVQTSNVGRTIYLNGYVDDYLYNFIFWNVYEDRYPLSHNVMREVENYEAFTKIQTLLFNNTEFRDDVENYTESGGRFKYTIQAPLNDVFDTIFTFVDTVYSNELLIMQSARLYVPNAFCPDGLNNIFKPVGVFSDKDNYLFMVYNRWGQKVFETTNNTEGWDGRYNGRKAEAGAYAYYIYITDAFSKKFEKRGTVMLMK